MRFISLLSVPTTFVIKEYILAVPGYVFRVEKKG
jgi:hypothetical protein